MELSTVQKRWVEYPTQIGVLPVRFGRVGISSASGSGHGLEDYAVFGGALGDLGPGMGGLEVGDGPPQQQGQCGRSPVYGVGIDGEGSESLYGGPLAQSVG